MSRVITPEDNYPIQPVDIDASDHLWDAFNHMETEVSAGWIIRFLQERGKGWEPFTHDEINAFYSRKYQGGFRFNRLVNPEFIPPSLVRAFQGCLDPPIPVGGGWIVLGDDQKYRVTEDFIDRCRHSSPAQNQAVAV